MNDQNKRTPKKAKTKSTIDITNSLNDFASTTIITSTKTPSADTLDTPQKQAKTRPAVPTKPAFTGCFGSEERLQNRRALAGTVGYDDISSLSDLSNSLFRSFNHNLAEAAVQNMEQNLKEYTDHPPFGSHGITTLQVLPPQDVTSQVCY